MDSQFTIIIYAVYFILLAIAFGIVRFVLNKIFRKDVSTKKMGFFFLIMLVLPFALFKGCKSCLDNSLDEYMQEVTQESYVRGFLAENEAAALVLPKFKVKSYDNDANSDTKWVIEFEEPIDSTQLQSIDQSGVAKVKGRVLFFPIVRGYSQSIDPDFLTKEDYFKEKPTTEVAENNGEEPDYEYDYRNFKLELLPDCKTAILVYSYHITYKEKPGSGGSSHHHHHHDD